MTKAEAKVIKELVKGSFHHNYYGSKTESMSCRVYTYINDDYDAEFERDRISKFMELIKDTGLSTEVIHRTYQGFIHDTCVIVK